MPSLVATMSALARTMCMRMHYVRTNLFGNVQILNVCERDINMAWRQILELGGNKTATNVDMAINVQS